MRIHMLGIGGTGMGALAGLLVEAGHSVTGTDEKLYPPMSDQIASLGIRPFEGYCAKNVAKANPELVIIGNVIRRENFEAQEVLRTGVPYKSMPEAFAEIFLNGRTPIVVTGTHGKTTSSALAAWILESAGERPGFLVGGVGLNFDKSFSAGSGRFFVVEGDEYDTAFFDKEPKFLHYRPRAAIITSIEFDHADIYHNVGEIIGSFRKFVALIPKDGLLVVNDEDANVHAIAKTAACRVVTYGVKSGEWKPANVNVTEKGTRFNLPAAGGAEFLLPMWGEHNLSNATGIIALLTESGIPVQKISDGIAGFKGVKRRQEIVCDEKGVTVISDFAHHPTAVLKTIESMRLCFPNRRLWAIFEPRSNTSKRNLFQKEFENALAAADRVVVASPYRADSLAEAERFNSDAAAAAITKKGVDAHHIPDATRIAEFVMKNILPGDVILVMSNGGFDGLIEKIVEEVKNKK